MGTVIKVENLGKQYRLGEVGTGTLSHDLNRWWAGVRGKEDPFAKVGEINDRTYKGKSEYVWALKDVNFEVKAGEVLGIIGRNGAGKSTLLKILSKVTKPSTGQIKTRGRIASLLEVGTGFHPEMTGRENVFLNGAIMGMTKNEIKRKFDEIVDFAGVERYIDTPVKRYSSGMYVRLAFAVAAHLEPEILIVDEVLAVGDAEFQKKCLGKMKDVSVNDGRTVLFVSHNMASVKQLCTSGLLLEHGKVKHSDTIEDTISYYQIGNEKELVNLNNFVERKGLGMCRVSKISILSQNNTAKTIYNLGETIKIKLTIKNLTEYPIKNLRIIIGVYNSMNEGYLRFDTKSTNTVVNLEEDSLNITCDLLEHLNIKPDLYSVNVALFHDNELVDHITSGVNFAIENFDYLESGREIESSEFSKVFYKHIWKKD